MTWHKSYWVGLAGAAALAFVALSFVSAAVAQDDTSDLIQKLGNLTPDQIDQLKRMGQQGQSAQNPPNTAPVTLQPAPNGSVLRSGTQLYFGQQQPPSRLEQIMSSRASMNLRLFGYDQLGVASAVTVPQTGAVQDDYVLGPGDEIVVSLRGQENSDIRAFVDRNGQVVLPRVKPVSAAGRTFGQFRDDLLAELRRSYTAVEAYVSIGRLRQVSVAVSGEVNNPGVRILTGLSSPLDAILLSGGVKRTGSLRAVTLVRGSKRIIVDLYGFLAEQDTSRLPRLTDGDRILVPPLGLTATVAGWVRRPAIYELAPGTTAISVRKLISLAGGLEVRNRYRLSILRILDDGRTALVPTKPTEAVRDSEILFALPSAEQSVNRGTLSGGTPLAGSFSVSHGERLSEVLRAPGALGPSPYTLFGILSRRDPRTQLRSLVAFAPAAVLTGDYDLDLQSDDFVRVFSMHEASLLSRTVVVFTKIREAREEATRHPENVSEEQLAQTPSSAPPQAQLAQTTSPANTMNSSLAVSNSSAAAAALRAASGSGPQTEESINEELGNIRAPDYLAQTSTQTAVGAPYQTSPQTSPQMSSQMSPQLSQQLSTQTAPQMLPQSSSQLPLFVPQQALATPATPYGILPQNFEEAFSAPGGVASNREVTRFGDLAVQLGTDPLLLANFLADHEVTVEGAVARSGVYIVGPGSNLHDLVMAAGGTAQWADESGVELVSTEVDRQTGSATTKEVNLALNDNTFASRALRPHDSFLFRQTFTDVQLGSTTVEGEVRYPGKYQIVRGEHLSDLLKRVGGLTDTAYPFGAIYLRHSVAELEQDSFRRSAREIEDQLLLAMTRSRGGAPRLDSQSFTAAQAFIDQLKNQKGLGRISIVADPTVLAKKPELDPLLESGDVLYVPQRPTTVSVLGEVRAPGSYPYRAKATADDYLAKAGGFSQLAYESETFVVFPDGSAERLERSWIPGRRTLPPGSVIVVPRDLSPLDFEQLLIESEQIFEHLAIAGAAVWAFTHK